MTAAWFNCHAGVAGDMVLAALVDAGASPDAVADAVAALGVDGYAMFFERVQRCGVGATWANIVTHDPHGHGHTHRPARDVLALIAAAELPDRTRERATAVYRRLAEVEGAIHGIDPDDVELHEVGALDSIIDVVGVCAALESLGVDEIRCSSIGLGTGTAMTAHGVLPHPAPATMALLTGAAAPSHGLPVTLETATPTGVALMTALSAGFGAMTAGTATSVGYGAGTADTPGRANVVQVVLIDPHTGVGTADATTADATRDGAEIVVLEANVDDVTGEVLAHAIGRLLDAGAHDAWIVPIVMKKGRPAHVVTALCDPARASEIRDVIVRETGTLGVRASTMRRWPQRRDTASVEVSGQMIGVKVAEHRVKVEFDDAERAAECLGLPVRTVIERAVAAWKSAPGDDTPDM